MKRLFVVAILFVLPCSAFSELTPSDIDKIREVIKEVIKSENAIIHSEMTALELRLVQKIQESENRLRSELNTQLSARMNDFTLIFGITAGGFFLLFATLIVANALKGRVNKRLVTFLVVALCCTLFSHSQLIAVDKTTVFDEILCRKLTVLDKTKSKPAIELSVTEQGNSLFVYGIDKKVGLVTSGSRSGLLVYGRGPGTSGPGLLLSATESDSSISLYNKKGETGVSLSTLGSGNNISLYNQKGDIGVFLSTLDLDSDISLYDGKKQRGVSLSTFGSGSDISLYNKKGETGVSLSTLDLDSNISLYDGKKQKGVALSARVGVYLFDKTGIKQE